MRKAKCSNYGKWFYNHNGLHIVLPDTYDDSMCPACNNAIDDEITETQSKKGKLRQKVKKIGGEYV